MTRHILLALACVVPFAVPARADDQGAVDLEGAIVAGAAAARAFVPFTLEQICKDGGTEGCLTHYLEDELVTIRERRLVEEAGAQVEREVVLFAGTAGAYVRYLNEREQRLNALGQSLRDAVSTFDARKVPTDVAALRRRLVEVLGVSAPEVLELLREPITGERCRQIPDIPLENLPKQLVELSNGKLLKAVELLDRLNQSQRVLCAMGYDLLAGLDLEEANDDPKTFLQEAEERCQVLLSELGLSRYVSAFNLESIERLKSYADIARDVEELVTARELPGPEQLQAIRDKLNVQLPPELQIPDLPNIPTVTPPRRLDLALKKSKKWHGLDFGDRKIVGTGADAELEVRGDRNEQVMTASASAKLYVLGREIPALAGYAQLGAGPAGVQASVQLSTFGQDIIEPVDERASVQLMKDVPDAMRFNFSKDYPARFAIGPVPVVVKLGARVNVGLGYSIAAVTTRLHGAVYPVAAAEAYVEAAAGEPGILAVGAEAKMTLLDLRAPLTGSASLEFDEVGYPYLTLGLDAETQFRYLDGAILAFADYPVPAVAVPPWKTKRERVELYRFQGSSQRHKIMSYRIALGRSGAEIAGDLLDQADQREAEGLEAAILLDQRRQAIADFEMRVQAEVRATFQGILADLDSSASRQAAVRADEVAAYLDQFKGNLGELAQTAAAAAGR